MAEKEPQPGPSGVKRKRTAKDYGDFVTTDVQEILRLIDDDEFCADDNPSASEDSLDEDYGDESAVQGSGGDVDIAAIVRDHVDRESRAELEAEYENDSDPDFEVDEGQSTDRSSEEESTTESEQEASSAIAASATHRTGQPARGQSTRQQRRPGVGRGTGMTHSHCLVRVC